MNLKIGHRSKYRKDILQQCLYLKDYNGIIKVIYMLIIKDYKVSNTTLDFLYYYILK
jgi:hypothetical protein